MIPLRRLLDLREGEGRSALVLFTHLFFITAAAIVMSAAKNGLFLSAYPADLIPHVIVASALTTAVVAVAFAGATGRLPRRTVVEGTMVVSALLLVAGRAAFLATPRAAFVLYLVLSLIGALIVAVAWGTVGDYLTGRQSRRLMPLLVGGSSVAGMVTGFAIGPAAAAFGTPNLLLGAAGALLLGGASLRIGGRPQRPPSGGSDAFLTRVRKGVLQLRRHRLISLLAAGIVLSTVIGTLVDYQFKAVLQQAYERDAITSLFGLLAGAVGIGTLVLQAVASRFLFRRWGLSAGPVAQAGLIGGAALAVAATGGVVALAVLRFVDETTRFTLQKSVEQVSVAPFPPEVRSSSFTLLGGLLKPLTTAATGLLLILLAPVVGVRGLAVLTGAAAGGLLLLFRRHPPLYRAALEEALARHTYGIGSEKDGAVASLDRNALEVVDRALSGDETSLTLFALSILRHAPNSEALPRLIPLLDHAVPEVRAEAAVFAVELAGGSDPEILSRLRSLLAHDPSPAVTHALLEVADRLGPEAAEALGDHLVSDHEPTRREALLSLARHERRHGGARASRLVREMLGADRPADRAAAIEAVAILGNPRFLDRALAAAREPATRVAAAGAFAALGEEAAPWLQRLLDDPAIDAAELSAMASRLCDGDVAPALHRILEVAERKTSVRTVLPSLQRARRAGRMRALPSEVVRRLLRPVLGDGVRYGIIAGSLRGSRDQAYVDLLAEDLADRQRGAADSVLAGLTLSYDPAGIDRVGPHLRSRDAAARSHAMELLEGILEADDRALILPFFEGFESAERLRDSARGFGVHLEDAVRRPLDTLGRDTDPWLSSAAVYLAGRGHAAPSATVPETESMLPLMEIVFFLKSSPLFRPLPGEELVRVARLATTVHLDEGQTLFREGDAGDAFYMVVSGRIAVVRGTRQINTLGPHEGVGEMALLDGEPRSASVRALESTTLLRIEQQSFEALVDRTPALARGIYRALSARLRSTLRQVE